MKGSGAAGERDYPRHTQRIRLAALPKISSKPLSPAAAFERQQTFRRRYMSSCDVLGRFDDFERHFAYIRVMTKCVRSGSPFREGTRVVEQPREFGREGNMFRDTSNFELHVSTFSICHYNYIRHEIIIDSSWESSTPSQELPRAMKKPRLSAFGPGITFPWRE